MSTTPTQLLLNHYSFAKIHVEALESYDVDKESESSIQFIVKILNDPDDDAIPDNEYIVLFSIREQDAEGKNQPIAFELVLTASVSLKGDIPEEPEKVIKANTGSILYGAAREMLSIMTSRVAYPGNPFSPALLPIIPPSVFVQEVKNQGSEDEVPEDH